MPLTAAQYLSQLQSLLPSGPAWPREPDSELTKFLTGLAEEFARIDARATDLLNESDPRTASETLDEWEASLGLPDIGITTTTDEERQIAIVARMRTSEEPTEAFFYSLAEALGYAITSITYYTPFVAGSSAGDPLSQGQWKFVFKIDAISGVNDPLFERAIEQAAPLHTMPIFEFHGF